MIPTQQTDLLVLLFVVVPALLFLSSSIRRQKNGDG